MIDALDWERALRDLDARGFACLGPVLEPDACRALVTRYDDDALFRSRVVMERHAFGRGEYKYFADPLPEPVATLRSEAYPKLAPLANAWNARLGDEQRFPATHAKLRSMCRAEGQTAPTPLLLRYEEDGENCLHQDLYGAVVFPVQLVVLLSEPGKDFTGGELVLTEQRPRMQSRVSVVPLALGEGALFAVRHRPVPRSKLPDQSYRVAMRHGVSRVRPGTRAITRRFTLGVIFHDAPA